MPTVHINDTDGVIAKVKSSDLTATIVRGDTTGLPQAPLPQIAGFSSRGPSNAVNQEFLKPDVAAPGVNVIAGVSPLDPAYNGNEFGLMSGTSMSSPNLAGMAALLVGKEADWSPMAIKSALMTTAGDVYNADGSVNADDFSTGSGSADPEAAARPGLVYESGADQWDALLCGEIAGREVNVPSVAIPDVVDTATVTRTVTAKENGRWQFSADVPGFEVTASPAMLDLKTGQSAEVELTIQRTDAAINQWVHGSMSWTTAKGKAVPEVTSPVTLKAKSATVTSAVESSGAAGSETVEIASGVTGELTPQFLGLGKVDSKFTTQTPGNIGIKAVTVAEGTKALVASVTTQTAGADWDLIVQAPDRKRYRMATANDSETFTVTNPMPGTWPVGGVMYATPDGAADTAALESLQLRESVGNMTVSPNPVPVTSGETIEATVSWSGLTQGTWKGVVNWDAGVSTNVTVDVP